MQYRAMGRTGAQVSALGLGCMRLPTLPGKSHGDIDEEKSIAMVRAAIDGGVNYIDTAFMYHDFQSEAFVGRALRDGYRERVYLATKSPDNQIHVPEDFEKVLEGQLKKLQTDYVDFYMFHGINREVFDNEVLGFELIARMERAKADGRVRNIGFSFHGDAESFRYIVDSYDGWDFCQVQMNYVDVENQATMRGVEYAAQRGLGIIAMEPLLGGKLAAPPEQVCRALDAARTPVEWALDFLWDRPEFSVVLSGMSSMEMITQNLEFASHATPGMLTPGQREMLETAGRKYRTMAKVPCTNCRYCMPCPSGLDIPGIYGAYNYTVVNEAGARERYVKLSPGADACVRCGACQKACPQNIDPCREMERVTAYFSAK